MINFVLPAIKIKWPFNSTQERIKMQQDNVRPHMEPTDCKSLQATSKLNLNIELVFQPPKSPDLIVLHL